MFVHALTPILNVRDIQASFAWFESFGWEKAWDWGEPPTFGAVRAGKSEIFLAVDCQGGRGRGENTTTFRNEGDESADKGVWMSLWVEDVDAVHRRCVEKGLEVTLPPEDMSWGCHECHVRHPDGHVFRVSQGIDCD